MVLEEPIAERGNGRRATVPCDLLDGVSTGGDIAQKLARVASRLVDGDRAVTADRGPPRATSNACLALRRRKAAWIPMQTSVSGAANGRCGSTAADPARNMKP